MLGIKSPKNNLITLSKNELLTKKNEKSLQLTFNKEIKVKPKIFSQDSRVVKFRIKDLNLTNKDNNISETNLFDSNRGSLTMYPKNKNYFSSEKNNNNLPNIISLSDNNMQKKRNKSFLKKKSSDLKSLFLRTCTIANSILNKNESIPSPFTKKADFNMTNKLVNEESKNSRFFGLNKQNTIIKSNNPLELSFGESSALEEKVESQTIQKKDKKKIKFLENKSDIKKKLFHDYKKIRTIDGYLFKNITDRKYLLRTDSKKPDILQISNLEKKYPNYPTVKYSKEKINDHISCYAVNTYKGLMKNHNEDKVTIILSITKPKNFEGYWPNCSFIALYDGKFGKNCSSFLRDKLQNYIIKNKNFPNDPKKAIYEGFLTAEKDFQNKIPDNNSDKSGSCALVLLIIDDKIYIANCGDSRAILSMQKGEKIKLLNKIHKLPKKFEIDQKNCDMSEITRIKECGGKILVSKSGNLKVMPLKLNITRSFGFENIKINEFRGKNDIIIPEPDINEVQIKDDEFDFLILASSGIFEQLNNEQSMKCIYNVLEENNNINNDSIHELAGSCVDMLIKTALIKGSSDDVTCILIGFANFGKIKNNINKRSKRDKTQRQSLDKYFEKTDKNFLKEINEKENVVERDENIEENKNNVREKNRRNKKIFTIRKLLMEIKEE